MWQNCIKKEKVYSCFKLVQYVHDLATIGGIATVGDKMEMTCKSCYFVVNNSFFKFSNFDSKRQEAYGLSITD